MNSGTRPRFDLKMVVGQVSDSVEVTAAAPLVNATTADLGVVVDQSKVEALPLNGRDFQQLVGLQAGVYASPDSFNGQRGGIEFNGASAFGNNLLMDGVDMSFGENSASASDKAAGTEVGRAAGNATGNGIGRGSLINTISVEAIQEFKATGSAFSAEYGRATGGVLNVTTKSGTGNVPTSLLLSMVTPAIRQNLSLLPAPTSPTSNPLIGLNYHNDSRKNSENTFVSRADWEFKKHRLSLRYNYNHQNFSTPNLIPTSPSLFPTRFHNASISNVTTISPTRVNELRIGFNRLDEFRHDVGFQTTPNFLSVFRGGIEHRDGLSQVRL